MIIINIRLGEVIVKDEFHVANDGELFHEFFKKLRVEMEFIAVGEDDN